MNKKINNTLFMYNKELNENEQLELYTMLYDSYDSDYLSRLFFNSEDNILKRAISVILNLRKNEDDLLFFINTVFDKDPEIRLNSLLYLREMDFFTKNISLLEDFIEKETDKNLINIAKFLKEDLNVNVSQTKETEPIKEESKIITIEQHFKEKKTEVVVKKTEDNEKDINTEEVVNNEVYEFVKKNIDSEDNIVLMNLSFKIKNERFPSKKEFILRLLKRVESHAVIKNLLLGLNTEDISQPYRREVCSILSKKTFFNELKYDLQMLKFYEVNEFMGNPQRPGFLKRCALFMLSTFGI